MVSRAGAEPAGARPGGSIILVAKWSFLTGTIRGLSVIGRALCH
jgi:hypothetical protein